MIANRIVDPAPPGGSARIYTLAELDESRDDALSCCECGGVINPWAPMTYDVAGRAGYSFYHPVCARMVVGP